MQVRTHLLIALAIALFLVENVKYNWIFVPVVLIATLLPDIDIANSYLGHKKIFRPLQWFTHHRGIIHSFTLCLGLSILLALFFPIVALPFFLGYGIHLIADSFTVEGIRPFWPFKGETEGIVRVGGRVEMAIFVVFAVLDVILFIKLWI